jgi:hypothetical protein
MPAKKPTVQTRLQKKAAKANKIVTGPKGSKPQSTTNAALLKQGNKTTRGGLGSGRPKGTISQNRPKPAAKPAATPAPKPAASAAPKASAPKLTNLNKPVMRTLVRKAAQARKAAAGRPLVKPAEAQRLMSQRAPNIRQGAARLRNITDTPRVRAAAAQGQQIKAAAQAKRARLANRAAKGYGKPGGLERGMKAGVYAEAVKQGLTARNTAPGTISSVDPKLARRIEAQQKSGKQFAAQEAKARKANQSRKTSSFDDAFRSARKAGVKTFTWKGKQYTTKMKGE